MIDKIVAMLDCHVSQFYEWLPYNVGVLDEVPTSEADRRAWLAEQVRDRLRKQANRFREALVVTFGHDRGSNVEYAEAFEVSEYGSPLDDGSRRNLFLW